MHILQTRILAAVFLAAASAAWAAEPASETPAPAAATPAPRSCAPETPAPESPGPDPVAQSLRHYVRGRILAVAGEHVLAAKELQQAAALYPKAPAVWLYLGLSLYDSGNVPEATKALDETLKLSPADPAALYYRARVSRNAGDLNRARDLLTKLADVASKGTAFRILGMYHLAQVASELKDVDTAIARYESLLEEIGEPQPFFQRYAELFMIYRGQLQVKETLGRLYLLRGDNGKAVAIFNDILDDRPDHYEVMGLLCHAYVQQKNFPLAREAARKLMEAKPDRSDGYQRLAEVYRAEGKPEGVIADLETFRKTQPGNRMLAFQLAGLYELFGRKDEAAKLYGEISVGADSSQGPSVAAALKLVELQVQANRPVEAIEALAVAISGAPADSAILVRGAQLIEGLKNPGAVYQDALRLVTDDQKNYGAFILVGMLAETVKRRDEAIVLYEKALQRQPKAAIACSRKADLLIEAQRPAEALAVYEAALKAGLDVPVFHRKMGMLLEFLDRPGEAMVQYRIARQAAPDDKPTRYLLAGLLARTGDLAEAEKELRSLLARFPKEVQAQIQLAAVALQKGDMEAADQAAGQALALEPGSIPGRAIRAELRFRQKKFDEAEKLAREILKERPEASDVRLLLALVMAGQKKHKEAAAELKAVLAANPENIEWRYVLAGIYSEMGDAAAAEQELQRILQKKPDHAPSKNDLGYMWADRGVNMAKAEQLIREALKSSPESPAYLDSLGWVLYKEGKFDEAVRMLQDATKAAPDLDAVLWDHLGDAYWRLSRQDDAKKAWEAAVKILGDRGEGKAGDLKRVSRKVENVQAGRAPDVAPLAPKDEPAPSNVKGASAR
jgi:tetratricopeptide (TPR) repeat protein